MRPPSKDTAPHPDVRSQGVTQVSASSSSGNVAPSEAPGSTAGIPPDASGSTAGATPDPAVTRDTTGAGDSLSFPPVAAPRQLEHSARIGRYTLLNELGRGGMGVVYRAWDPLLERTVALKMLLWGGLASEAQRRRFLQEAKAVARLDHPAIVSVLDSGVHEGCPYYTMEYVSGPTLRFRLERDGALPVLEAVRLIATLSRAVQHAHERGIVHRDIKPANILLEPDGHPRLSDFGVARADPGEAAHLTATGQIVGTPGYMAPEQALGESGRVGPRADVYSLGAVLFHMVAGRSPFGAFSPTELLERGHSAPPELRRQALKTPLDVDRLCQKAMAPDPADRYRDAGALAEDAERYLRGEPVLAARPGLRRRLGWQVRRHRALLIGIGTTLLVALMVMGGWQVVSGLRAHRARQALERRLQARLESLEAEIGPLWAEGKNGQALQALEAFLDAPEVHGSRAAAEALVYAGRHEQEAGDLAGSLDYFARAYVLYEQPEDQLEVLIALSDAFHRLGDGPRLIALHNLLVRRQAGALERPELEPHLRTLAMARRDLAGMIDRLDGTRRAALSPLLEAFSRIEDTGHKAEGFWWTSRSRGLPRGFPGEPTSTAVVLVSGPGAGGNTRRPTVVSAPPGTGFAEPVFELGNWEGAPLFAITVNDLKTREPSAGLYRLEHGRLEPLLALPLQVVSAACRGDLDGDGRDELYLGGERRLYGVYPDGRGGFRIDQPFAAARVSNSDISALFAADLDADGRQELVAALDGWLAYDVRVFRRNASSEGLSLVARRKLGWLVDAAPFPLPDGHTGILAVRYQDLPNQRAFPAATPSGMPVGTYLLRLKGAELEVVSFVPSPVPSAVLDRLSVGDFDGDGRSDFALRVRVPASDSDDSNRDLISTQIGLGRPDGGFVDLNVGGLRAWSAVQADDDPASELLAQDTATGALWVLGAGTQALPPLDAGRIDAADAPDQPADVWRRIEDLVSLGLTDIGVEQLHHLAAAVDPGTAGRALLRAGELAEQRGQLVKAAGLYQAASVREAHNIEAVRRLAGVWKHLWKHEDELSAREALLELPGLPPAVRRDTLSRIDALHTVLARPEISLAFKDGMDPRWRVDAPHLVHLDSRRGMLVVRTLNEPIDPVRLPLTWSGGRLSLETELDLRRLEWGSSFEIGLRPVDAAKKEPILAFVIGGYGGGGLLYEDRYVAMSRFALQYVGRLPLEGPKSAKPVSFRLELDPQSGQVSAEADGVHRIFPILDRVPAAGDYELYVTSHSSRWTPGSLAEVGIGTITLRGAALPPIGPVDRVGQARRLLAEGRYEEASAAAEQAGVGDEGGQMVRYLADCRRGLREACLDRLERLVAAHGAGAQPLRSVLRAQLRESPALFLPALARQSRRAALELFYEAWQSAAHAHPDDQEVMLAQSAGLSALDDLGPSGTESLEDAQLEVVLLKSRGQGWRRLNQHELARAGLGQALARGQRLAARMPVGEERLALEAELARVELEIAISYTEVGQLRPAIAHLRSAIERSPIPELLTDEALARPEIEAFLDQPELGALLRPVSYHPPSSRDALTLRSSR